MRTRTILSCLTLLLGTLAIGCASATGPSVHVMQTGGVYPSKPPGCPLGAADINDPAYERIGMITVQGGGAEAATKELREKACAIGGDALYMNMATDDVRAYTVLRYRPKAP